LTVSVIIVAYESGAALTRCLDSLGEEADEVIVVDNGTGGPELDDARARAGVRVVEPGRNLGFAAANNLGAAEASGDVLFFLNPDTVVAGGAIPQLARTLEDSEIGIAMARLRLLEEPEKLNSSGVEIHVTGIGWAGGFGEPVEGLTHLRDVPAPSGTAMAMRTKTFQELGGFAEELFMYLEDLELGWRARLAGLRVVVDPEADVYHEYEFGRHASKNYFLERNRLAFCFSAYSARLLFLLSPLLVSTELGMLGLALKEGWVRDKLSGWAWCVRNTRVIARRRRATQALRKVSDRQLAGFLTPVFSPGMLSVPGVLRVANPLVERYWAVVRRAL
jgi:GT2 family glycosyltransferase